MMPVATLFTAGQQKKVSVVSLILPNMAAVGSGRIGGEPTQVGCHYVHSFAQLRPTKSDAGVNVITFKCKHLTHYIEQM